MKTYREIEALLLKTLNESKTEILSRPHPDDLIAEFVDSAMPIYYGDIAEILVNCPNLGFGPSDTGLLSYHDGNLSAYDIVSAAIYENLSGVASEWLSEQETENA